MSCLALPCKCEEFEKTTGKIKREMMTEAMKVRPSDVELPMEGSTLLQVDGRGHFEVMTLKFLRDAPPEPPKNPFAIFVGEKRRNEVGLILI